MEVNVLPDRFLWPLRLLFSAPSLSCRWFLCRGQKHTLPSLLCSSCFPTSRKRREMFLDKNAALLSSICRHISFKRHLPRQMHVSSMDYGMDPPPVAEQPTSIGRIKPELYKQKSVDSEDPKKEAAKTCGKINFTLKYDYENETLTVRILRAFDLPAKDFCGSSDPYVKIYLLPDRKRKFQTRVHRKTLNPTFDESFHFPVPHEELVSRKLHLSVFDFDRFSRHDMIGEVILENLFEDSDLSRETSIWKDIQYATTVSVCPAVLGWVGLPLWLTWALCSWEQEGVLLGALGSLQQSRTGMEKAALCRSLTAVPESWFAGISSPHWWLALISPAVSLADTRFAKNQMEELGKFPVCHLLVRGRSWVLDVYHVHVINSQK